jgi:hypothetical protein
VPANNLFKSRPVEGFEGTLSDLWSQVFKQCLKALIICMFSAHPFESSVCNGIPFSRIGQKVRNAVGEFVRTIEHDDFLADAKILFEVLSWFSEQTTAGAGHFKYARLDLTTTVRSQPAKMNARVSEVQSEHRLPVDAKKIRGRDRP